MSACTIECVSGCERASARGIPQSSLKSAFSGVYSLPEGAGPEARGPSHRGAFSGV